MTEIGWTDEDGDHGHLLAGREAVQEYLADDITEDVVAIFEQRNAGEETWNAVLVSREIAESIVAALQRSL